MQIRSVGIDLGKTTFHLVALGASGKVLVKKKFTQKQLLAFTANMQTSLIGLEACSGAHFLGRALKQQGHDVRLIAAQFVKPFVKSNKNDFVDAEAIAEAVERKNMRFVPIKTDDQLDLQAMHRIRDGLVSRRTAVINQMQRSMVFPQKPAKLKAEMADVLENADNALTPMMRNLIGILWDEWKTVEQQIDELTDRLEQIAASDAGCCRIRQIPGIGPIDATATWHMEMIARLCTADQGLLLATPFKVVDLGDDGSIADAVAWWTEMTTQGQEGMTVKPAKFIAEGQRSVTQPAIKCRGAEYLRIIYGPEYLLPENLERLRSRNVAAKRSLASRQFALGIEALERFVRKDPLRLTHECVFAVLALESEPVDPRL